MANGICVSGTAAGSFFFPICIEYLIHLFGFHGTILILGGCMLHVCLSATLYRPFEANHLHDGKLTNNSLPICIDSNINNDEKQYIDQLFMEESKKNHSNDFYNINKLGKFQQIYRKESNDT